MSETVITSSDYNLDFNDTLVSKLKSIRPYTESQLLGLHQSDEIENNASYIDQFIKESLHLDELTFYKNLESLIKWRYSLSKTLRNIENLKEDCDNKSNVWLIEKKSICNKGRCNDGRLVEAKITYDKGTLNDTTIKTLDQNLALLKEAIINDYCYYLYMAESCKKYIESEINQKLQEKDNKKKNELIKPLLSSLFAFNRRMEIDDESIITLIKHSISRLVAVILKHADFSERLFLLNHVLRSPGDISSWAIGFIQCPNPMEAYTHEEAILRLNHCLNVISTILSPVKARETYIESQAGFLNKNKQTSDDYWHFVDTDLDEGEDILVSAHALTEIDIIQLLKQVPFNDVLFYLTHGSKKIVDDPSIGFVFGTYNEMSMLKLLAVSTKIVQILRKGLLTFNCMRFTILTDYITMLIKNTVTSVADFWNECKTNLKSEDVALVLRSQVEYDHFILRSVVTILSCQKFGIWKFVSVIPFNGVTESMMWHIIWVFYNNGRDEIDELGGLCPYFSDAYWKSKFNEKAMKFLFQGKLPSLSLSESECLLKSLSNMIKSRNETEKEFVNTIALEIFEIFVINSLDDKILTTSIDTMNDCIMYHPFIITALLKKLGEIENPSEKIIELFLKMPIHVWNPTEDIYDIFSIWICDEPITSLTNRIARIVLIKLNYGFTEELDLYLKISKHRQIALIIYNGIISQVKPYENYEMPFRCSYGQFSSDNALKFAESKSLNSFIEWAWRLLLLLKLNRLDKSTNRIDDGDPANTFLPLPNLNTDCDLLPVYKGVENKHPFALYISLIMTDIGHKNGNLESCVEMINNLLLHKCYLPVLNILRCFIPLHIDDLSKLSSNNRFLTLFNQLLLCDEVKTIDCVIGMIKCQLDSCDNEPNIIFFWIDIIYEITLSIFKQYSSSWFVASSRGLQQIVQLFNEIIPFVFVDDRLTPKVIKYFAQKLTDIQKIKISYGTFSNLLSWNSKKNEFLTPFHYLKEKYPNKIWLSWLIIRADSIRFKKIWELLLNKLSENPDTPIDAALKNVCNLLNNSISSDMLPIYSWSKLAFECPVGHPLNPSLWFSFFSLFFASSNSGGSFGLRFFNDEQTKKLKTKLNQLIDHHHKSWSLSGLKYQSNNMDIHLIRFYRASVHWLQDLSLHDPFVDIDHLPAQYCAEYLKCVMDSSFKPIVNAEEIINSSYSELWKNIRTLEFEYTIIDASSNNSNTNVLNMKPVEPPHVPNYLETDSFIEPAKNTSYTVFLNTIRMNIDTLMEEKNSYDNMINKAHSLNYSYINLLSDLYKNVNKVITVSATCDAESNDKTCSGPALIQFRYSEAQLNPENSKLIERNRIEFSKVISQLLDSPNTKAILSSIEIEKTVPLLSADSSLKSLPNDPFEDLLKYFLKWIEENSLYFSPVKHIFNLLIDSMNFADEMQRDTNSYFLLEATLKKPSIIEYLAPRLVPSKCTISYFLRMYKLLASNINTTPSHLVFVLLSKFDVNSWLKVSPDEKCIQFLNVLMDALYSLGKNNDQEKSMVLGLYRKHLNYIVICRFPNFVQIVIHKLLEGMNISILLPGLWNDVLMSFGLFQPSNKVKLEDLISELRKYANRQPLFSSSELYALLNLMFNHFQLFAKKNPRKEFIDHFKSYLHSYILFLSTVSHMWIRNNQIELGIFRNIWDPFFNCWKPWIFPKYLDKTIDKRDFEHIWNMFTACLDYLTLCFQDRSSDVLSLSWRILAEYYNKEYYNEVCPFSLIMQEKLKTLPWNRYVPTMDEIELMHNASQKENCTTIQLISHMLYTVNWSNCLQTIHSENISLSMDWLANIIIHVVDKPYEINLEEIPLKFVNSETTKNLCILLQGKINLSDILIRKTELNIMYMDMIKILCEVKWSKEDKLTEEKKSELIAKHLIFAEIFCNLTFSAIRNDPNIIRDHKNKIISFFSECLNYISIHLSKDSSNRLNILKILMHFLNNVEEFDQEAVFFRVIWNHLVLVKNVLSDVLSSCVQCIKLSSLFVKISEKCIISYAAVGGKYDELTTIFNIREAFEAEFLKSCIDEHSILTLFLFYQSNKASNEIPLLTKILNICKELKPRSDSEAAVFGFWFYIISNVSHYLTTDDSFLPILQITIKFIEYLVSLVDEVFSAGIISSLMKFGKKTISLRSAFLALAFAGALTSKIQLTINSYHPFSNEVNNINKIITNKLIAMRKNKGLSDTYTFIDKAIEFMDSENKDADFGLKSLEIWLKAYFSTFSSFNFIF